MSAGRHGLLAGLLSGAGGPLGSIVLVLLVIAFLIYRQIVPRQLSGRSLLLVPVVLFYFLVESLPSFHPDATKLAEVGVDIVVNLVLGLLATRQLRVYASPASGRAMASGSWTYFLWWLLAFAVKAGLAFAFGDTGVSGVSQVEILIPVFILVVTRNLYLYWKARQLGLQLH
jgi:hypothetical protein